MGPPGPMFGVICTLGKFIEQNEAHVMSCKVRNIVIYCGDQSWSEMGLCCHVDNNSL